MAAAAFTGTPLKVYNNFTASFSLMGEGAGVQVKGTGSVIVRVKSCKPFVVRPLMKNVNEGKGIFAPVVVVVRNIVGKKTFNSLRGKSIALHSQVITEFCKSIGADAKQ
ncbi:hypothetical protein KI387_025299, partial [Taxus chinensis]